MDSLVCPSHAPRQPVPTKSSADSAIVSPHRFPGHANSVWSSGSGSSVLRRVPPSAARCCRRKVTRTAGLVGGGSATTHELMELIDDFFKTSRKRAKQL